MEFNYIFCVCSYRANLFKTTIGGFKSHASASLTLMFYSKEGWKGLVDEIEMEVNRISERNLGRDDRYRNFTFACCIIDIFI